MDDAKLQKVQEDVVSGKARQKRRSGVGVGFSSDSEEEDERAQNLRGKVYRKKRKLEGRDDLDALS